MPVTLDVSQLRWIADAPDDPHDLCAHGHVDRRIDGEAIAGLVSYECTVSAAALYVLRSLSRPHEIGVNEHLFPCCGCCMSATPDPDSVLIIGCPSGVALNVRHDDGAVVLSALDHATYRVDAEEWRTAVCAFADRVASLYRRSSPKQPSREDLPGFQAFLREWYTRRGEGLLGPPEEARLRAETAA